ncbi:MAG: hypothetical protein ACT4PT_14490 [Methanobacteriota archaeon]
MLVLALLGSLLVGPVASQVLAPTPVLAEIMTYTVFSAEEGSVWTCGDAGLPADAAAACLLIPMGSGPLGTAGAQPLNEPCWEPGTPGDPCNRDCGDLCGKWQGKGASGTGGGSGPQCPSDPDGDCRSTWYVCGWSRAQDSFDAQWCEQSLPERKYWKYLTIAWCNPKCAENMGSWEFLTSGSIHNYPEDAALSGNTDAANWYRDFNDGHETSGYYCEDYVQRSSYVTKIYGSITPTPCAGGEVRGAWRVGVYVP